MWRWVIGGAVALLLAFGIVAGIRGDGDWGDGRDGRVERIVNADGTETLVVHDGWDRGGFPFGIILVPLVILGTIALARGIFGRGPGGPGRWGGPGGPGGPGTWGYGPPWAWDGPTGPGAPVGTDHPTAGAGLTAAPPWFEEWHRRAHEGGASAPPPAPEPPAAPMSAAPAPAAPPAPGVD